MVKNKDKNKDEEVVFPRSEENVFLTEEFQQRDYGVFHSEASGLDLGIDLSQNKEVSATSFSLVERPARSSEKGEVLWERKIVKDEQNGVEVRESWDNEVLNERRDGAVVPEVKEGYEGNRQEASDNLVNQEEVVIRSSKWQTEKNEFEEKLTIKFDKGISSRRLTDGGQVNFVEYHQVGKKPRIEEERNIVENTIPMNVDQPENQPNIKLLSGDEIRNADMEQLEDLKKRVDAEWEIRRQVSQTCCKVEVGHLKP